MIHISYDEFLLGIEAHIHHHVGFGIGELLLLLELELHPIKLVRVQHAATIGRDVLSHISQGGAADLINSGRVVHQVFDAALKDSGGHNAVSVERQALVEGFDGGV